MARIRQGGVIRQVQALLEAGAAGGLTDGQLLERFTTRGGAAAELAFAALLERHGPMVLRTCRAILRDHHEAHDAFQATFLVLVQRAGALWTRDSLGPWLYQVAYRTASCARSVAARRRRHERQAAEGRRISVDANSPDDLGVILDEEFAQLPEPFRTAVALCLIEGLTHEQAARHLDWPVGTVESRLARGRRRLRARLAARGLTPSVAAITAAVAVGRARAAVPTALAAATTRAAMRVATGRAAVAEVVSAGAAALVESTRRRMSMSMLKLAGAVALAVGLAATGVWANQKDRTDQPAAPAPRPLASPTAKPVPEVVARVDGKPITRDQLIERCLAKYGAKELESLINREILAQAGARRGLGPVTVDELDAEAAKTAEQLGLTVNTWYRTLEAERGITRLDYSQDVLSPNLLLRKLQQADPAASFEALRDKARIEIFLERPRGAEQGAKQAPTEAQPRDDRLRAVERRLEEAIEALERLKQGAGR